ncbi:hypothetical protein [Streptomyces sp. NPDC059863]
MLAARVLFSVQRELFGTRAGRAFDDIPARSGVGQGSMVCQ